MRGSGVNGFTLGFRTRATIPVPSPAVGGKRLAARFSKPLDTLFWSNTSSSIERRGGGTRPREMRVRGERGALKSVRTAEGWRDTQGENMAEGEGTAFARAALLRSGLGGGWTECEASE